MQQTTPTDAVGPSLLATVADRCPNCDAPMAADQRYCTECGQRRGQPRLPFMDGRTRPAAVAAPVAARRTRMSPSTTLIAGVCTLLLAMGVGVLIGRSGSDDQASTSAPAVQVVSVPGAAAAPAGATAATGATAAAAGAAAATKASRSASAAGTASKSSSTTAAKPTAAARKAPKVVKLGDKCTGRGCTNGKFTGDFFGGG
jgi:hypothetical protein